MCLLISCNSENNQEANKPGEAALIDAESAFLNLKKTLESDGNKLWQTDIYGPILLVDRETRKVFANEPDTLNILKPERGVYTGFLPEEFNIANTAIEWLGERWAMISLPLPESKHDQVNLLIHESFHRLQPSLGFDSLVEIQSKHLDTKEGRILLKLELEALKLSLQSKDFHPHIRNALVIRTFRQKRFSEAWAAENSLEINEGLAEYTGSILSGRSSTELEDYYSTRIDAFSDAPSFVRSFAYMTLPAYGYFLRQLKSDWNLDVNDTTDITQLLRTHFTPELNHTTNLNLDSTVLKQYNIDEIVEFESKRELDRLNVIKSCKLLFTTAYIVEIPLIKMNIGFNPGNVITVDSLGTIYPVMRITDDWGILQTDSIAALLSDDWKQVTLSAPIEINDTLIKGDRWTLRLKNDYHIIEKNEKYLIQKTNAQQNL